jgi:hypothetical protein
MTAEERPLVLSLGEPARSAAVGALWLSIMGALVFVVFAVVTTQDHAIRTGSPWQDDPYDVVVSFTMFLVPALVLLMLVRMRLCSSSISVPVFRVGQLLRAATVNTVLIAGTFGADWVAVAGADHKLWNAVTPVLLGVLGVLSAWALACFGLLWKAGRRLPYWNSTPPDGDWVGDAAALLRTLAARIPKNGGRLELELVSAVDFVRGHVRGLALAAATFAGIAVNAGLASGEGWTNPLLIGVGTVMFSGGVYGFAMVCNAVLQIAITHPVGPVRRAARIAGTAAALALPTALALRDTIWVMLGNRAPISALGSLAILLLVSALLAGTLAFIVSLAASKWGQARDPAWLLRRR